jgi:hypothetical protein
VVIWYTFHHFGILCKEKSGNPGSDVEIVFFRRAKETNSFDDKQANDDN